MREREGDSWTHAGISRVQRVEKWTENGIEERRNDGGKLSERCRNNKINNEIYQGNTQTEINGICVEQGTKVNMGTIYIHDEIEYINRGTFRFRDQSQRITLSQTIQGNSLFIYRTSKTAFNFVTLTSHQGISWVHISRIHWRTNEAFRGAKSTSSIETSWCRKGYESKEIPKLKHIKQGYPKCIIFSNYHNPPYCE